MHNLQPIELDTRQLGRPLSEDLYNRHGVLVAARGTVIDSPERLARFSGQGVYRRLDVHDPTLASPLDQLQAISRHYVLALNNGALDDADGGLEVETIQNLAHSLSQVVKAHPEICTGMALQLDLDSIALRHSLHVGVVAILLARVLEMDEGSVQSLACAALTMNLRSLALHDALTSGMHPDAEQHRLLREHPLSSAGMLLEAGVSDPLWLEAVVQHHENLDGSGYPRGLRATAIGRLARVLRTADVWCAQLAHRHNRICRYPGQALRLLFQRERGRLDDAVLLALRNLMGHYPPGTLVRLANRETAMVTRWFSNRSRPDYVVSLLRPSGDALRWPERRQTGRMFHAIRDYTYLPQQHVPVDWGRVWALA